MESEERTKERPLGEGGVYALCDVLPGTYKPPPRRRFILRRSVVTAEKTDAGWMVYGTGWLTNGKEFSDEDFEANFEEI